MKKKTNELIHENSKMKDEGNQMSTNLLIKENHWKSENSLLEMRRNDEQMQNKKLRDAIEVMKSGVNK